MIYVASKNGTYPKGLHWTAGEVRDVSDQPGFSPEGCPGWLTPAKAKPPKKASKKDVGG